MLLLFCSVIAPWLILSTNVYCCGVCLKSHCGAFPCAFRRWIRFIGVQQQKSKKGHNLSILRENKKGLDKADVMEYNINMKIIQLQYFVEVVKTNNISKAAKNLYVSQPAISSAIRELEKEFNTTLFIRYNNQITLTDEGHYLYRLALDLLENFDVDD